MKRHAKSIAVAAIVGAFALTLLISTVTNHAFASIAIIMGTVIMIVGFVLGLIGLLLRKRNGDSP